MKYLFLTLLGIMIAASIFTYAISPEQRFGAPIIYWTSDPNPARKEQIHLFHKWLLENGYVQEGVPGSPLHKFMIDEGFLTGEEEEFDALKCVMQLDAGNNDISKKIIQGVSGAAGDIIDLSAASGDMVYLNDVGMLTDLTPFAEEMGFGPDQTWPAIKAGIGITDDDGNYHQIMFPCNVHTNMLWVNKATFKKYGMKPPPEQWTFEEFEKIGKEFIEKANKGKRYRDVFFCMGLDIGTLHRSLGVDSFNETQTRCITDDPRFIEAVALKRKWIDEDHILPSEAEVQSFATQAGYAGSGMQLFNSGNAAMFGMGRYALIQLRQFDEGKPVDQRLQLSISQPPHGGYPNIPLDSRGASFYKQSENPEMAVLFLKFLASEEYNNHIVKDADAMPPNPKYTETEEFKHPKDYPNEWDVHERFAHAVNTIAIAKSHSPYVSPRTVFRELDNLNKSASFADAGSPEKLCLQAAENINNEIQRTINEKPARKEKYLHALEIQKKIDAQVAAWKEYEELKSKGKKATEPEKIRLGDITNAFYSRYYQDKGWAE